MNGSPKVHSNATTNQSPISKQLHQNTSNPVNNSPKKVNPNSPNKNVNNINLSNEPAVVEEVKKKTFTSVQGYALHEILGKGSFGQVFKATKGGKAFAIKMIDKPLIRKKNLQKYVNNEVKVMRELKNPNTVRLFEAFEDKDVLYLVMECCNQGTLFNHILKNKPGETECIRIFAQIMRGFIEIHEKHILHRDLKPSNIFIKDGIFKIADFGLAKPKALGSSYCGTSYFMAPEILMKKVHDYKVDLWSMGVILFFMLFREYPFKNSSKLLDEITLKTIPIFEVGKCLKHPKSPPYCSVGASLLFQRIFVIDPSKRISFKELYDMDLFSDYFSVDELHHSSRIYQDLEKQKPKPGIEDHHDDEDEDHHHHNVHQSSIHHCNVIPNKEDQQNFAKAKTSKFKPPSPTSLQIELSPVQMVDQMKQLQGGISHSNKNKATAPSTSQMESLKYHQSSSEGIKNGTLVQDHSREIKIQMSQNSIGKLQIGGKLNPMSSQQHMKEGGFEDENEFNIFEDESPQIVLNNIKIGKNPSNTIKYFGPKAFQDAGSIMPSAKMKQGDDDETQIPSIPSSFVVYNLSCNGLNNVAQQLENSNKFSANKKDDLEIDIADKELEVVEKAYNEQKSQDSTSSSESGESMKAQAAPQKSALELEIEKQYENVELIQGENELFANNNRKKSLVQAIAFPEKEDVSNEANLKKMTFRKAPSLRMNMIDYAMKDKFRKQILEECDEQFEPHVLVYLYEIGVYGILGDTIDSLNVLNLGSSTQSLVNYLLSKLLIFFAKKLLNSLQKVINIFNLNEFGEFSASPPSTLLKGKILRDINQWSTKFTLYYYGIDQERDIQSDEVRRIVTEDIAETDFDSELKIPTRLVFDLIFKASYKMGRQCHSNLQACGILRATLYILLSMLINNVFEKNRVRDYLYYYFIDPKNIYEKTLDFVNFNLWTAQAQKEILLEQIHHLIKIVFGEKKLNILKAKI